VKKFGILIVVLLIVFLLSPSLLYQDSISIIGLPLYLISLVVIFLYFRNSRSFPATYNVITKSILSSFIKYGVSFSILTPLLYLINSSGSFIDPLREVSKNSGKALAQSITTTSVVCIIVFFISLVISLVKNYSNSKPPKLV